jgi:hypothetical protein
MMMLVNPGTSSIREADKKLAKLGIAQFVTDLDLGALKVKRDKKGDCDGWFGFKVKSKRASISVLVPGIPMEQMRRMERDDSAWNFRRLYVEGSSWLWNYALERAKEELGGKRGD